MNGRTFSQNPRTRGNIHHQFKPLPCVWCVLTPETGLSDLVLKISTLPARTIGKVCDPLKAVHFCNLPRHCLGSEMMRFRWKWSDFTGWGGLNYRIHRQEIYLFICLSKVVHLADRHLSYYCANRHLVFFCFCCCFCFDTPTYYISQSRITELKHSMWAECVHFRIQESLGKPAHQPTTEHCTLDILHQHPSGATPS